MKLSLLTIIGLVMTFGLISCGKKAQENKAADKSPGVVEHAGKPIVEQNLHQLWLAVKDNDLPKVQKLLWTHSSDLDLDQILSDGETLLTTAVQRNYIHIVDLLIENDASINRANLMRQTPLMVAAKNGYTILVKYLISVNAKLDNKDVNGDTALIHAIQNKHQDLAIYLINSKANIDITNNDNLNALKIAEQMKATKVIELISSLNESNLSLPDGDTFVKLLVLGDVKTLTPFLKKYPEMLRLYQNKNPFVIILQNHGNDQAMALSNLLLDYKASADPADDAPTSALIEAVKMGSYDFARKFLYEGNADPDFEDQEHKRAIIWAVESNRFDLVHLLLERGAKKSYSYSQNGKRVSVNVCDVAKRKRTQLEDLEAKIINEDIQKLLNCGWRRFF